MLHRLQRLTLLLHTLCHALHPIQFSDRFRVELLPLCLFDLRFIPPVLHFVIHVGKLEFLIFLHPYEGRLAIFQPFQVADLLLERFSFRVECDEDGAVLPARFFRLLHLVQD